MSVISNIGLAGIRILSTAVEGAVPKTAALLNRNGVGAGLREGR